jgi:hypothetical protein
MGTCFQVAPGVLVTAWHVLDDIGAAAGDVCVRERPLHGRKVTRPTDTPQGTRLPLGTVPGLYQAPGSHSSAAKGIPTRPELATV